MYSYNGMWKSPGSPLAAVHAFSIKFWSIQLLSQTLDNVWLFIFSITIYKDRSACIGLCNLVTVKLYE